MVDGLFHRTTDNGLRLSVLRDRLRKVQALPRGNFVSVQEMGGLESSQSFQITFRT